MNRKPILKHRRIISDDKNSFNKLKGIVDYKVETELPRTKNSPGLYIASFQSSKETWIDICKMYTDKQVNYNKRSNPNFRELNLRKLMMIERIDLELKRTTNICVM